MSNEYQCQSSAQWLIFCKDAQFFIAFCVVFGMAYGDLDLKWAEIVLKYPKTIFLPEFLRIPGANPKHYSVDYL